MYVKLTEQENINRRKVRKEARRQVKEQAIIKEEKSQKPVKSIIISIEWKKSRMWGSNPHAEARVSYDNGTGAVLNGFTASGCGYCKESTVIAAIFNASLRYKLHEKPSLDEAPYGIHNYSGHKGYSGGIGTSCYYEIAKFIGGTFENVASGKTFDVFKYTDGN